MRKHLTYANVAATLALVFAMTGGALAAKHYLINSTKQINPKVLKKLRGKTGPRGATGAAGAPGKEGPAGKQGGEGKAAPAPQTISNSAASVPFGPPKSAEVIAKVSLPPGTYTLLASAVAQNNSAAPDKQTACSSTAAKRSTKTRSRPERKKRRTSRCRPCSSPSRRRVSN